MSIREQKFMKILSLIAQTQNVDQEYLNAYIPELKNFSLFELDNEIKLIEREVMENEANNRQIQAS